VAPEIENLTGLGMKDDVVAFDCAFDETGLVGPFEVTA
jgi:hypothetical protein